MRKIIHGIVAALFFGSCLLIAGALYNRYNTNVRVEVVLGTHINSVKRGDDIIILSAAFDSPKECAVRLRHYLVPVPFQNTEIMFQQTEYTTSSNPDKENPVYTTYRITIPTKLTAGDYLYFVRGVYYCHFLDYLTGGYDFTSTPIQIRVTNGDSL
jgi:hypothetical protein